MEERKLMLGLVLLLRSIRAMRAAFAMLGRVQGLLTELRGNIHDIKQRDHLDDHTPCESEGEKTK